MNPTLNGNQDEVDASECQAFVSRAMNNPFNDSGIDTGAASAGSTKPARDTEFPTSHDHEFDKDMDIVDFVSQTYIHGTPVHLAEKFTSRDNAKILVDMLNDDREAEHWGNIVFALGVIGDEDAVPHIIDWMDRMSTSKMDWTTVRQVSAGMMGLGYLGNRTDDSQALSYLAMAAETREGRDEDENAMRGVLAQSAAIGIAMLGSDKAFMMLEELERRQGKSLSQSGPRAFDELFELHADVREFGVHNSLVN